MAGRDLDEALLGDTAQRNGIGAARMEMAARRGMDGRGHVAGKGLARARKLRVGHRRRGQQRFRVRMHRPLENVVNAAALDDASQVHHGDVIGDVAHHAEVVCDEEVGQSEPFLHIAQQVQDSCA